MKKRLVFRITDRTNRLLMAHVKEEGRGAKSSTIRQAILLQNSRVKPESAQSASSYKAKYPGGHHELSVWIDSSIIENAKINSIMQGVSLSKYIDTALRTALMA